MHTKYWCKGMQNIDANTHKMIMQINVLNIRAELSQNNSIKCLRMLQIWYKKILRLFSSQIATSWYWWCWLMAKFLERIQSRQAGARELIFWELLATWIISKLLIQNWDKTSIWVVSVSKEAIHPDHLAALLNQDDKTWAKNHPDVLIMTKRSWAPKLS